MERKIKSKVRGYRTTDGAGVSLVRVLGLRTSKEFDPILMLDSFDSTDPKDYTAGFPMHPHRGIETISYVYKGKMLHRDSIGHSDEIGDGEVQWMNSGSGIMHEEKIPAADRLLGVQLWLNLPSGEKMSSPSYHSIKTSEIEEIPFDGGYLRLLSGKYGDKQGFNSQHLPLNYLDIHLDSNSTIKIPTDSENSIMLFTLLGDAVVAGEIVEEKTAVKLSGGDFVEIKSTDNKAQVLFMESKTLNEPIAWAGPIVMNSQAELDNAFSELRSGKFIKQGIEY